MTRRKTIFVFLCAVLIFACAASGCSAANMRKAIGTYELTAFKFQINEEPEREEYDIYFNIDGKLKISGHKVFIDFTIADNSYITREIFTDINGGKNIDSKTFKYYRSPLKSGEYDIESLNFYDDFWGISYDNKRKDVIKGQNNIAQFEYTYIECVADDGDILTLSCTLTFTKVLEKDNDNNNPVPTTDFEKIKKAYADAGYGIDIENSLDEETKATIEIMKNSIEAIGCKLGYIGKGIGTANMELYLIVGTDTTEQADQLEQAFSAAYQYRRSDKDLIFFMNPYGTPDFEPFVAATS